MAKVIEKGPIVGSYMDRGIPSYFVDEYGRKFVYVGLAPQIPPHSGQVDLDQLTPSQAVLAPGLLYSLETSRE